MTIFSSKSDFRNACFRFRENKQRSNHAWETVAAPGRWQGGNYPPMIFDFDFFFFLLISSAVGQGHDSVPTLLWKNLWKLKMCRSPPPPPPPSWATFFRAGAKFLGSRSSSKTFAPHPTPMQTPWRRPCWERWYDTRFMFKNWLKSFQVLFHCKGIGEYSSTAGNI